MNLQILPSEHQQRLEALQQKVKQCELDVFLVSSFESIFYLTGAGFEPLERPFFLLVRPQRQPVLLVPKLDQEHMKKAYNIRGENVVTYWEYPTLEERGWPNRVRELIRGNGQVGVEPSVRREITDELQDCSLRTEPLVEELRAGQIADRNQDDQTRRALRGFRCQASLISILFRGDSCRRVRRNTGGRVEDHLRSRGLGPAFCS